MGPGTRSLDPLPKRLQRVLSGLAQIASSLFCAHGNGSLSPPSRLPKTTRAWLQWLLRGESAIQAGPRALLRNREQTPWLPMCIKLLGKIYTAASKRVIAGAATVGARDTHSRYRFQNVSNVSCPAWGGTGGRDEDSAHRCKTFIRPRKTPREK